MNLQIFGESTFGRGQHTYKNVLNNFLTLEAVAASSDLPTPQPKQSTQMAPLSTLTDGTYIGQIAQTHREKKQQYLEDVKARNRRTERSKPASTSSRSCDITMKDL